MTTSQGLAQALVNRHVIAPGDVNGLLRREQDEGESLALILLREGRATEKDVVAAVADQMGLPFVDFVRTPARPEVAGTVGPDLLRHHQVLPVEFTPDGLLVAVADPHGTEALDAVAAAAGCRVSAALADRTELAAAIEAAVSAGPRPSAPAPRPDPLAAADAGGAAPPADPGRGSVGNGDGEVHVIDASAIVEAAPRPEEEPVRFDLHVNDLLERVIEVGASDLHLTVGSPPQIRLHGDLQALEGFGVLETQGLRRMLYAILTQKQREKLEGEWELDMSHPLPGKARFRVNMFFQREAIGAVMRTIPDRVVPLGKLGVPAVVREFADYPRGLVLVTGPTGSGKSTTLASVVDVINGERPVHIMTVEDPIEFLHTHKRALVNQREVGEDTKSFAAALKHVLRQDPDVILVGEMRDLETIQTALTAAETGHLVFATLHTQDAPQSVDRVIDVFPPHQQQQVRVQLATSLQAVMTQQLIQTRDGRGRMVACEVMIATPAIRNLIREGKIYQIYSAMQSGGKYGMQTMDQALADLVKAGKITYDLALERSADQADLARLCGRA